jgi:8-oxo-dGTP diphosphatase
MNQRTHVAVGVIYNSTKDKVLVSKRSDKQHLAGYWEFPGGKVEINEEIYSALKRELFEELGIVVNKADPYTSISYDYPDKKVLLDVWKILEWSGGPVNRENQEICWVDVDDLNNYKFPDANKYIIQSILLDPFYVISQESYEDYSHLYSVAKACFSAGLKLFQLRLKIEKNQEFQKIVNTLSELARQYNAKLILNGAAEDIEECAVDGIHLKSNELTKFKSRPIGEGFILGASCHNEEDLINAAKLNVNYAFISPVSVTDSHPGIDVLGWEKFSYLNHKVDFPIYALGGMTPADLKIAKSHGAYGIAMIGAIWNSNSPADIIKFSQELSVSE